MYLPASRYFHRRLTTLTYTHTSAYLGQHLPVVVSIFYTGVSYTNALTVTRTSLGDLARLNHIRGTVSCLQFYSSPSWSRNQRVSVSSYPCHLQDLLVSRLAWKTATIESMTPRAALLIPCNVLAFKSAWETAIIWIFSICVIFIRLTQNLLIIPGPTRESSDKP